MKRIRPNSQLPKMRAALFIGDCATDSHTKPPLR
jgi:hypothetical protein